MSKSITLKPAGELDKEYFRSLNRRCYEEMVTKQFDPWDDEHQNQSFESKWPTNNFQKIHVDNKLIGGIWFDKGREYRQLREIQIDPEFQNQGIGESLLIKQLAHSARPIRLRVLFQNPAKHLDERLGFKVVDQNEHQYIMEWQPND